MKQLGDKPEGSLDELMRKAIHDPLIDDVVNNPEITGDYELELFQVAQFEESMCDVLTCYQDVKLIKKFDLSPEFCFWPMGFDFCTLPTDACPRIYCNEGRYIYLAGNKRTFYDLGTNEKVCELYNIGVNETSEGLLILSADRQTYYDFNGKAVKKFPEEIEPHVTVVEGVEIVTGRDGKFFDFKTTKQCWKLPTQIVRIHAIDGKYYARGLENQTIYDFPSGKKLVQFPEPVQFNLNHVEGKYFLMSYHTGNAYDFFTGDIVGRFPELVRVVDNYCDERSLFASKDYKRFFEPKVKYHG